MYGYRQHVKHYFVPRLGRHPLQAFMRDEIIKVLGAGSSGGGRPLSGTTLRRTHATLHRAPSDAVGWGSCDSNPPRSR